LIAFRSERGEPIVDRTDSRPYGCYDKTLLFRSLAFTPDGSQLVCGSEHGTIIVLHHELAALAAVPVAQLNSKYDYLLTLRRDGGRAKDELRWLDFMIALVERHSRFDVEIEDSPCVEIGEFDIEIER